MDTEISAKEDWSFAHLSRAETLWGPHGYHRYPAKFIPQLVRRIIERYSEPGMLVGDPFLGSATTGVEALRTGRRFYGSEINPVALLISRAKCAPIEPQRIDSAWTELNKQIESVPKLGKHALTCEQRTSIVKTDIARATEQIRFHYWFPTTVEPLETILKLIIAQPDDNLRVFFLCAFSNILRGCSIWLSGSTKPQKDLNKKLGDPVDMFRRQARDMIKRNLLFWNDLKSANQDPVAIGKHLCLKLADARKMEIEASTLDLLVTSPPYATCYEYLELHQLTQLWLQRCGIIQPNKLKNACIGGSRMYDRVRPGSDGPAPTGSPTADAALRALWQLDAKDARQQARALFYYFQDIHRAILEFARIVRDDGRMVLIVGDSSKLGINIPTSAALCEMASDAGFELQLKIVRKIPVRVLVQTRDKATGRFSASAASDTQFYPEEDVLVFKRRARSAAQ